MLQSCLLSLLGLLSLLRLLHSCLLGLLGLLSLMHSCLLGLLSLLGLLHSCLLGLLLFLLTQQLVCIQLQFQTTRLLLKTVQVDMGWVRQAEESGGEGRGGDGQGKIRLEKCKFWPCAATIEAPVHLLCQYVCGTDAQLFLCKHV